MGSQTHWNLVRRADHAESTANDLRTELDAAIKRAEAAERRCKELEQDRDKLVSVARSFWRRTYGWDNSLLDDEHVISDYLAISTLGRDTFDRLVKGGG